MRLLHLREVQQFDSRRGVKKMLRSSQKRAPAGDLLSVHAQVVEESLDAAIEVATDSRLNVTGKFYGAGVLKSHFKGVTPAPIDVRASLPPPRQFGMLCMHNFQIS